MVQENTHLTQSMKESAYFNQGDDYDKNVYENDLNNWFKIVGMLMVFYVFQGLHWWANFELGTSHSSLSTYYNLIAFLSAIIIISIMVFVGSIVNRKKLTHEFYVEKISEETQRQAQERANAQAKAENEAKIAALKAQK